MAQALSSPLRSLVLVGRMIKFEHSVFALPFAYIGAFLAARGWPGWGKMALLTVAMVAVRSFAMAVNRLADLPFDRENPRTSSRPLVTGEVSVAFTVVFTALCGLVFVAACAGLNSLCLALSVPALIWSGLYSFTKRYTWACHFFLGSVLALAPVAGWIAVVPGFTLGAVLFFLGVLFWVAGFDILYSCQDADFDRARKLHSLPADFGVPTALALSTFCHVNTVIFFLLAGRAAYLGWIYYLVTACVAAILLWEHTLVSARDLRRLNLAFFTMNGVVSVFVFAGVVIDLYRGA